MPRKVFEHFKSPSLRDKESKAKFLCITHTQFLNIVSCDLELSTEFIRDS